jgi:hypothetical protein
LKIGDETRTGIDEAIRVHDKVLSVLSENSVQSAWVKKEVETAFEKEQKQNRMVLFPIRLDDAVMETDKAWAADIRRMRNIGDFRAWKDHDKYKEAFGRLMQDLRRKRRGWAEGSAIVEPRTSGRIKRRSPPYTAARPCHKKRKDSQPPNAHG